MHPVLRVVAIVVAVVLLPLTGLLFFTLGNNLGGGAASVGIIGGADGPTAIYLAGRTGLPMLFIGTVVAFAVGLLLLRGYHSKNKAVQDDEPEKDIEELE